jgi:uncharacterized protein YqiB (DUF1249 family)
MDQARARLFPIFLQLNNCVRKVSWFDSTYEINWRILARLLRQFTTEVEQSRYLLASRRETGYVTEMHEGASFEGDVTNVRTTKIVSHAEHIWESRGRSA